MTREILFRGKRVDTGEWVYGHYTQGSEDFHYITNPNGSVWQVDPSSIGEFTGLHDKDGNKIFEGDWLDVAPGYSSLVKFEDGMFVSVYSHPEDGETIPLSDLDVSKCYIIHDNPELLNP